MAQVEQFKIYCAVYGVLEREGKIFALRRANTGYADGHLHFPSGHVEAGELPVAAIIRELKEEAGIDVRAADVVPLHVQFSTGHNPGDRTYANFYYKILRWEGEPHVAEPHKADEAVWLDAGDLPDNFIRFQRPPVQPVAGQTFVSEFVRKQGDKL